MIKGFDGIRALAVIVVFFNHWTVFGRSFHTGDYGVWTFFVLSGFLIIRALHKDRIRVEKGVSAKSAILEFYARRALRIFPVYYATLLALTFVSLVHPLPSWDFASALAQYTYTTNIYIGEVKGAFIGWFSHFWSLAVEQQFYLLAAPLFLLVPSRLSLVICGAVSLIGLAVWSAMHLSGAPDIAIYTNSLIGFGMITMGGLAALLLSSAPGQGSRSWLAAGVLAAMALLPLLVFSANGRGVDLGWIKLLAVPLAAVLLAEIFLNQQSALVKILEWTPLRYLGVISYGFYIFHNMIPRTILRVASEKTGIDIPVQLDAPFGFAVAVVLAHFSWIVLERPLLRLKKNIRHADRVQAQPSLPTRRAIP
jgi:peptidoglycan/LPS O-acetylase OafA/YrhL